MKPSDELAYRLALRGMFARCRTRAWNERIDALMGRLVKNDPDKLVRFLRLAREVAESLKGRPADKPVLLRRL